ncbi:AraC family transcriptional regulator [Niveibacterium terrae]|uniref:AraC family transcriptional regulator n=1 Tax=Niveibacterium terrae TaxID=3373598 RepID=UPI003A9274EA
MQDTWLSSVMLLVHQALIERGLDANAIALSAGLSPALLADPNARIDLESARTFWLAAVEACSCDPCFGLDVARQFKPTTLHALGFAWMASGTLREAGRRLVRYFHIVNAVDQIAYRESDGLAWFAFHTEGEYTLPRTYDARAASLLRMCRALLGEGFVPSAVRLPHAKPAPEAVAKISEFFGIEPEWGADECALAAPCALLDLKLSGGNSELALAAEKIAADYLARHARDDVLTRARRVMIAQLSSGTLSRESVASALAMSERTLQRRLAEHGESFAKLLEDLRQELAQDYLRSSRHSIHEIAFLLGFAELASFTRAFRRWQGVSPSAWREEALSA